MASNFMHHQQYHTAFMAADTATRHALKNLRDQMQSAGFPMEFISRVELVLAELFNNITEHAYARTGTGPIWIDARKVGDVLNVRIRDKGNPMPGGIPPVGHLPASDVALADLPEGGFGWHLIRTQSQGLRYQRQGDSNLTFLRFRIGKR